MPIFDVEVHSNLTSAWGHFESDSQSHPRHSHSRGIGPVQSFGAYEAVVETGDVILAEHGLARSLFIYFCLPPHL